MGIISEQAAQTLLAPHHDVLFDIVMGAGADYASAKTPAPPSRRTRANILNDAMIDRAKANFPGGVAMRHHRNLLLLQFAGTADVLINFKKLNRRGRPSNYPTPNALLFQQAQQLPGLPDEIRLTLGYDFDETHQRISEVRVLQQDGDHVVWSYEILPPGATVQLPLVVPIVPIAPAAPATLVGPATPITPAIPGTAATPRVKAKPSAVKKKKAE